MNLTHLKASAELAKTSQLERDNWGEDIDPDEVLRLVEVARAVYGLKRIGQFAGFEDNHIVTQTLNRVLEGIES